MPGQMQLFADNPSERWTVRVSRRARRLSVRVYPGGRVEVVVPPSASAAAVQQFIGTHRRWIHRRIEDLSTAADVVDMSRPARIELPAVGRSYAVEYEPHDRHRTCSTRAGDDVLLVRGPLHDEKLIAGTLRNWLAGVAHEELGRQLWQVAEPGGFRYSRVQIRRQRTRWGSCSASGTISLNVCLMFLRPAVVRYLLVHELCHTRHMNHSQRFWALVEHHEPEYRALDRELLRGWQFVPGWMFS